MGPQSERVQQPLETQSAPIDLRLPRSMRSSIDTWRWSLSKAATVRWFPWQNWAAGRPRTVDQMIYHKKPPARDVHRGRDGRSAAADAVMDIQADQVKDWAPAKAKAGPTSATVRPPRDNGVQPLRRHLDRTMAGRRMPEGRRRFRL